MPEAIDVAIQKGLYGHVSDVGFSPALPIAWTNMAFTPPVDGERRPSPYLRVTLMPAEPDYIAVPSNARNRHEGLLQVDVFHGQNSGETAARRLAATVGAHFARGTKITTDGITIHVTRRPRIGQSTEGIAPWRFIPVVIRYLAFA